MPDTEGAPLLGEILGEASSCEQCGAPLPAREHAVVMFEDTGNGWEQLCTTCSGAIDSVDVYEEGDHVMA